MPVTNLFGVLGRALSWGTMARHVLPDYLAEGLTAVFVGMAAGETSAQRGHYYTRPGNEFWQFISESRLIPEFLGPERDAEIILHGFGLTDLVKHRSGNDAVLSSSDLDVPAAVAKIERYQPAWVAFTSKAAAQVVSRSLGHGRSVSLGRQRWKIAGAKVFVLPSSSGSNRNPAILEGKATRLDWFRAFGRAIKRSRPVLTEGPGK